MVCVTLPGSGVDPNTHLAADYRKRPDLDLRLLTDPTTRQPLLAALWHSLQ